MKRHHLGPTHYKSTRFGGTRDRVHFNLKGFHLRCVEIDGQPWFAASDVCAALGLKNPSQVISILQTSEVSRRHLANGRARPNNIISEAGLYTIIMRAQTKNPEAKAFQDWVTLHRIKVAPQADP